MHFPGTQRKQKILVAIPCCAAPISQGADISPPPPLSAAKAGRNHLNDLNTPLHPTGDRLAI